MGGRLGSFSEMPLIFYRQFLKFCGRFPTEKAAFCKILTEVSEILAVLYKILAVDVSSG